MDLKAPGSGESHRNRWSNLDHIGAGDEIKFVLADREDYEWMRETIRERDLAAAHAEPPREHGLRQARGAGPRRVGARGRAAVRVQLQMHKYIWGAEATGVLDSTSPPS